MARRKVNVANFGSHWLKPPGVPKTLHQMREEKREQEEHAEAVRREQLAQELAEAGGEALSMDGMMDDVQQDGGEDLDDDIPEAGDDFLMGGDEDDDDDDGDDDDDDADDDDDDEDEADGDLDAADEEAALREERHNDLVAARMRMTDDAFREALIRGDPDGDDMYGSDEELQEQGEGHMLDEDDFAHDGMMDGDDDGMGIDMDANLDDDIPEAESGGYEHTDSEADLTSSDNSDMSGQDDEEEDEDEEEQYYGGGDIGFAPRAAPLGPPQSPTLHGRSSLSAPRLSMDLSGILSHDESSYMASSPAQARRARHG